MNELIIEIIQPDDWHIHLREGKILDSQYFEISGSFFK